MVMPEIGVVMYGTFILPFRVPPHPRGKWACGRSPFSGVFDRGPLTLPGARQGASQDHYRPSATRHRARPCRFRTEGVPHVVERTQTPLYCESTATRAVTAKSIYARGAAIYGAAPSNIAHVADRGGLAARDHGYRDAGRLPGGAIDVARRHNERRIAAADLGREGRLEGACENRCPGVLRYLYRPGCGFAA